MASFVLVDNVDLKLLKGAKSVKQLECWAELVCPKHDFLILSTMERRQWSVYNIAELAMIYGQTTGKKVPIGGYSETLKAVIDLARELDEDATTFEVLVKRLGGKPPTIDPRPTAPCPGPNPEKDKRAMAAAEATRQARAQANATAVTSEANASPGQHRTRGGGASSPTPTRPKGGITGQVWAIADTERAKLAPAEHGGKAERAAIIGACTAAGIDPSTAATQYSKWKRAGGAT